MEPAPAGWRRGYGLRAPPNQSDRTVARSAARSCRLGGVGVHASRGTLRGASLSRGRSVAAPLRSVRRGRLGTTGDVPCAPHTPPLRRDPRRRPSAEARGCRLGAAGFTPPFFGRRKATGTGCERSRVHLGGAGGVSKGADAGPLCSMGRGNHSRVAPRPDGRRDPLRLRAAIRRGLCRHRRLGWRRDCGRRAQPDSLRRSERGRRGCEVVRSETSADPTIEARRTASLSSRRGPRRPRVAAGRLRATGGERSGIHSRGASGGPGGCDAAPPRLDDAKTTYI